MNLNEIYTHIDHTQLKQTADWASIQKLCDEAIEGGAASVCIPPCYVKQAADYVEGRMKICTVIGFPNGYQTTTVKLVETKEALADGAEEIDMVINLCDVKNGNFANVAHEIKALKQACGNRVLKVIVETCFLTEEEKVTLCHIVTEAGADYIKTSTGFGSGGATIEDVELFRRECGAEVKIKAAGGIRTQEDAEKMIEAGADRLGSSALLRR
ncbi:MAG: deoxyribose-phosphate aldolase [Peptococcaceae bacterium]|nr:deoxyribose-phosphate aldolase [Peptococcaceae bacterium]